MASLERTRAGTWRVRWYHDSRRRAQTFPTREAAQLFVAELVRATRDTAGPRITLTEWAAVWLTGARNLSAGGLATYQRDLDRYILPELGGLRLEQVTPDRIDAYLGDQSARLAPSSVHRHYRVLRRMLQVAVNRGRLYSNPCDPVTPPRVPVTEMRFLTTGEVDRLAAAITPRYRAWVYCSAYLGWRWSEGIGLQRRHINGRKVTIAGQLARRKGVWTREEPKTRAGRRTVTAPAFVADILAAHLEEYAQPAPDGLVFVNRAGRPLNGPSFRGSVFKPALTAAGLDPKTRVHDLRHTAVALAVAVGAHPKAIQARLGHASIAVTLDRYGHLLPGIDGDIADALDLYARPSTLLELGHHR